MLVISTYLYISLLEYICCFLAKNLSISISIALNFFDFTNSSGFLRDPWDFPVFFVTAYLFPNNKSRHWLAESKFLHISKNSDLMSRGSTMLVQV